MNKFHTLPLRVYFEDTDTGGLVYYANYLKFAERGRTELLRYLGISHAEMIKKQGVMFVVRSCLLNCLAPARLDDVLEVRTYFKKLSYAKLEVSQTIVREDQLIATLEVVLACINALGKPIKMDDRFRHLLETYESNLES
ncbi:MAG: tol-pal system-associated acyl-CoA thioesterase [Alphaproteobacteria bacterium 41-28]|nr:MAG: tol-pal system-associated acyl-CoA thioesterase [Alphaproteobacteria bacterium 41-28]